LLKEFGGKGKIDFEISAADPNSGLEIAKVYIRNPHFTFTD